MNKPKFRLRYAVAVAFLPIIVACQQDKKPVSQIATPPIGPTLEDAKQFVADAESSLANDYEITGQAFWVQANFVTDDTNAIAAKFGEESTKKSVELALATSQFKDLELDYDTRRKLNILQSSLVLPAPSDGNMAEELSKITSSLDATYAKGCDAEGTCYVLGDLSKTLASSNDPNEMLEAWVNWRTISPQMKADYQRMVEIANQGSQQLGYADTGALWRSNYDMPADAFADDMDRVWGQVKPLYDSLQCHVRAKLNDKYGDDIVSLTAPIPAHLLGNMWAQSWENVYDDVAPETETKAIDVTKRLAVKGYDEKAMVRTAENFFTSLGFEPLPDSFWTKSLFTKPKDRDVQCHASAWDLSTTDYRIKMCINKTGEDFSVIHHELGHNFYQRAYNLKQDFLYRNSANDGFHEAIGDTIALSITPKYLKEIGLIDKEPDASGDLPFLMKKALEGVSFLPFGLLVDKWRWGVFSGEIPADKYNQGWWDLREKYQGVKAPIARSETDFDPGAKYHVPGNTPYSRYFLARILQFQFHRELCKIAGNEGPLHRCSIYGNKQAGAKLISMLEMGASRPWQDALEAMTGQREMDATAIIDYFAPLKTWLDEQNKDRQCGW